MNSAQGFAERKQKALERIRKLLRLAENCAASDGEIKNAMDAALGLIAQYQFEQAEIEVEAPNDKEEQFASAWVSSGARQATVWAFTLADAVAKAVGSVGVYEKRATVTKGVFEAKVIECGYTFYGPAADVQFTQELYSEWLLVITTIGQGRYGNVIRNGGREYCQGFSMAIHKIAEDLYRPGSTALPGKESHALVRLNSSLAQKRSAASDWLKGQGVTLRYTKVGLPNSGSTAYINGYRDGQDSGFGVSRQKPLGAGR
jgi:hypothetical protein